LGQGVGRFGETGKTPKKHAISPLFQSRIWAFCPVFLVSLNIWTA